MSASHPSGWRGSASSAHANESWAETARLPDSLPTPEDDGAADHLPGMRVPAVTLASTSGGELQLDRLGSGRTIVFVYPLSGRPDVDIPQGWNSIPGARGCNAEACGFRDHHRDLVEAGARRVFGLSSQTTEYQREMVDGLGLSFAMLSDPQLALGSELRLPTFQALGHTLYKRLTLVLNHGEVEHVFYPVFPPNRHAEEVLAWLK